MTDHIIQKKGESTWYVRLAIPVDVQKAFGGRKVLIQSLKTGLRSEAMIRRHQPLSKWKQQIDNVRAGKVLPESWAEEISDAISVINQIKTVKKRQLIGEDLPLPISFPVDDDVLAALEQAGVTEAIRELQDYLGDTLEGKLKLQEYLAATFIDLFPEAYAKRFNLSRDQGLDISALVRSPDNYKTRSPITQNKIAAFRAWYTSQGKTLKTIDVLIRKIEMLSEWLNGTGNHLSFNTVSEYIDGLVNSEGKPLATKTKKQHIWACNAFWKWAIKYDSDWRERFKNTQNPFDDHDLPIIRGEATNYDVYTKIEGGGEN